MCQYPYISDISDHNDSIIFVNNIYVGNIRKFGTENDTWRLDIIQNFHILWQVFLSDFLSSKCFDTPRSKYVQGEKCFDIPQAVYYSLLNQNMQNSPKMFVSSEN